MARDGCADGGSGVYVTAANSVALTEVALNGAAITVSLGGLTFASGVSASGFALVTNPTIAGLSIANAAGGASGSTSATLTLGFTRDFDTPATLAVRVRAATHSDSTDVTTGRTVPLTPTDEAPSFGTGSVSAKTFFRNRAIIEFHIPDAAGGNEAIVYTISSLPVGLVFDADDTGSCPGTEPRDICSTPTTATIGGADDAGVSGGSPRFRRRVRRVADRAAAGGLRAGHGRVPDVRCSGLHCLCGTGYQPVRAGGYGGQTRLRRPCAVPATGTAGGPT